MAWGQRRPEPGAFPSVVALATLAATGVEGMQCEAGGGGKAGENRQSFSGQDSLQDPAFITFHKYCFYL